MSKDLIIILLTGVVAVQAVLLWMKSRQADEIEDAVDELDRIVKSADGK